MQVAPPLEGIAHAEFAQHLQIALLPEFNLFGHDNIVPLFAFWARHGARLLCTGLPGF